MAVKISDRVGTFGQTDIYATHDGNRGALGFHAVNSLSERNQIPYDRRRGTYQGVDDNPYPFFVSVRTGDDVALYWLKNEPQTDETTDGDWEEFIAGTEEPFQGFFDPNTDSFFTDGTGTKGHYWIAIEAGDYDAGSGTITFAQYDEAKYDGSMWIKVGGASAVADWNTMINKPAVFTPEGHNHPISEVTGLQAELDNKVDISIVEHTMGGSKGMIPSSFAVVQNFYGKTEVDNKFANLSTYGIKYAWNSSLKQDSQSGMILGDLGLRNDEQQVYKWSGTAWDYFFTVSGGGGTVTEDIVSDLNVGAISVGETISIGTNLTQFIKALLKQITYPTYAQPTASITLQDADAFVEIGSIISPFIVVSKNDGDSGGLTNYTLRRGSTVLSSSSALVNYEDIDISIEAVTTYQSTATFAQGAVKNDSTGAPYPTGRIPVTTVTTNTITITPQRNLFYGVNVDVVTSGNIRGFGNTELNPVDGMVFNIHIPAGTNNVAFAYPASLGTVGRILDNGSNLDIKSAFILSSVNVEGANGYTAIAYHVYNFAPVAAYSQEVTYTITI